MEATDHTGSPPRLKRWQVVSIISVVLFTVVAGVILFRNQQQWNVVRKFRRELVASGGTPDIQAWYGTDFVKLGPCLYDDGWRTLFSWPHVDSIRLRDNIQPLAVDWTALEKLRTQYLVVQHREFSDADLESIPDSTPLIVLRPASPKITNASIPKIKRFTTLYEVSTLFSSIDRDGLMQIAKETKLRFDAKLTPQDFGALREINALHRLTDFELDAGGDFQASMLRGMRCGGDCTFHGKYGPDDFRDVAKGLQKPIVSFARAELAAPCFGDIATMVGMTRLAFIDCQAIGSFDVGSAEPRPETKDVLQITITNSNIAPDHLRAFAGRKMEIRFTGEFADDDWLHAVMQIPGVQSIVLAGTRVSDEAAAQYPLDLAIPRGGMPKPYVVKVDPVADESSSIPPIPPADPNRP